MFSMLGITRRLVMAHSPYFCGIFGFVLIGSGIIGTLVAIVLVKKLYELVLVLKLAVAGHCISISLLYLALNYNHQPANSSWTLDTFVPFDSGFVLLTLSGLTGFFGHMVIPIGLDLAGDCSFPHNTQAASNGLLLISGYVQSLLYAGIMQAFSTQVIHCKGYKDNNDSFSSSHVLLVSRMSGWQSLVDRLCNTYTDYSGNHICKIRC